MSRTIHTGINAKKCTSNTVLPKSQNKTFPQAKTRVELGTNCKLTWVEITAEKLNGTNLNQNGMEITKSKPGSMENEKCGEKVRSIENKESKNCEARGAFHYTKDSGNFGWNSNGKVRFGFF